MEAQLDSNVKKNKQINREKKIKKRTCAELNRWKIEELEKILGKKKELNMN